MGLIEAVAYWPPTNKSYFFRGAHYVRYRMAGPEGAEELIPLARGNWTGLSLRRVDAAATVPPHNRVYLFSGDRVAAYRIAPEGTEFEMPIPDLLPRLPAGFERDLDAAVFWPPDGRLYLFRGDRCVGYDMNAGTVVSDTTPLVRHWPGVTFSRLDAVLIGNRGRAYFFSGEEYVTCAVVPRRDQPLHAPRPWADRWPGLRDLLVTVPGSAPTAPAPTAPAPTAPAPTTGPTTSGPSVSGPSGPGRMAVGFNYPWAWNQMGTYFGGGPRPGSEPTWTRWRDDLRDNLRRLRTLGIRHVRIFLLGNAWNYGTLTSRPPLVRRGDVVHALTNDTFAPPATLHPAFLADLRGMLEVFTAEEMLVLPSFLSFDALLPSSMTGGGGRAAIVTDPTARAAFLAQVVEPFLDASVAYRRSVYAWEVINEPVWNTSQLHAQAFAAGTRGKGGVRLDPYDAAPDAMASFIADVVGRIRRREFPSTVGHRYYADLTGSLGTGSLRQFHYYPQAAFGLTLPFTDPATVPTFGESNALVGEIAVTPTGHGGLWPELRGADAAGPESAVAERLRLLESKGYRLAFLWPDGPEVPPPAPEPLKLSAEAQRGVARFLTRPRE